MYSCGATTRIWITYSAWLTLYMTWIRTYSRWLYHKTEHMNRIPYSFPRSAYWIRRVEWHGCCKRLHYIYIYITQEVSHLLKPPAPYWVRVNSWVDGMAWLSKRIRYIHIYITEAVSHLLKPPAPYWFRVNSWMDGVARLLQMGTLCIYRRGSLLLLETARPYVSWINP